MPNPLAQDTDQSITVVVNGEPREIAAAASLLDLLRSLDLDPRVVVVEHNRHIVRRPELASTTPRGAGALRGWRLIAHAERRTLKAEG